MLRDRLRARRVLEISHAYLVQVPGLLMILSPGPSTSQASRRVVLDSHGDPFKDLSLCERRLGKQTRAQPGPGGPSHGEVSGVI
jgi:hypothetical protein